MTAVVKEPDGGGSRDDHQPGRSRRPHLFPQWSGRRRSQKSPLRRRGLIGAVPGLSAHMPETNVTTIKARRFFARPSGVLLS
jgi:hypothetical protein